MNSALSFVVIVCGLVLGVLITVQLDQLFRRYNTTDLQHGGLLEPAVGNTEFGPMNATLNFAVSNHNPIQTQKIVKPTWTPTIDALEEERMKLLENLKRIESKLSTAKESEAAGLNAIVSLKGSAGKRTPKSAPARIIPGSESSHFVPLDSSISHSIVTTRAQQQRDVQFIASSLVDNPTKTDPTSSTQVAAEGPPFQRKRAERKKQRDTDGTDGKWEGEDTKNSAEVREGNGAGAGKARGIGKRGKQRAKRASINMPDFISSVTKPILSTENMDEKGKTTGSSSIAVSGLLDSTASEDRNNLGYNQRRCPYDFKVYVYPIPYSLGSVRLAEEARENRTLHICQKCILEQFALEYIVTDFFNNFCGRTHNPEEADFFYLPIVRDAEYRLAMAERRPNNRAPSMTEQAILNIMEKGDSTAWVKTFNVSDKYWRKHQGGDHILVMPAPVTNLRHQSSQRGFFHYMIHLYPPIFLGLEYTISFVEEYPICATKKNIVVPYPTTDPDLFSGKLYQQYHSDGVGLSYGRSDKGAGSTAAAIGMLERRKHLLFYAGGVHGDCIEIRRAMKKMMANSTHLAGVVPPPSKTSQAKREYGFLASTFCPIPVGDSPSSKRMYDVLNFGCIPVILSDDLVYAYTHAAGGPLNASEFSLQFPQSVVQHSAATSIRKYRDFQASLTELGKVALKSPSSRKLKGKKKIRNQQNPPVDSSALRLWDFRLPVSGIRCMDLLLQSQREGGDYEAVPAAVGAAAATTSARGRKKGGDTAAAGGDGSKLAMRYVNPLVQILRRVPEEDIAFLQAGVRKAAPHFQYYAMKHSHFPSVLGSFESSPDKQSSRRRLSYVTNSNNKNNITGDQAGGVEACSGRGNVVAKRDRVSLLMEETEEGEEEEEEEESQRRGHVHRRGLFSIPVSEPQYMRVIPTAQRLTPNGGAMKMIARLLTERKKYGIEKLRVDCQAERNRKGHRYVSRYACEPDEKFRLRRERNRQRQRQRRL